VARKSRVSGGIEPDDLKALRAGKTIFIEGTEEAEKRVRSLRVTIAYHRDRGNEKRWLMSRQQTLDGKVGKVVWLEEPS
jgi:hypothetical protein